jgi:hypothetical protein
VKPLIPNRWALPAGLTLVLIAVLAGSVAAADDGDVTETLQTLESQVIFERAEDAIFQVRVIHRETGKKSSIGSGFIHGADNRLATNYHVVSHYLEKPETYRLEYVGSNRRTGDLQLIGVDAVHDLAIVQSDEWLGTPLPLAAPPQKGSTLYAMGNPLDLGLTLAGGTNGGLLDQTDGSRILFSGSLNPGMSGGPTFDQFGRVVGINVATARNDISFIVPTSYLGRIDVDAPVGTALAGQVGRQVAAYQRRYIERIRGSEWPATELREMQIPAAISPTVRCWDASPSAEPEHLYRRFSVSCENENSIYLSDRLEAGKILYEFIWVESDELERPRFFRLYEALNSSQFGGRATEDEVERFRCETRFVDVNGIDFKATLCHRGYRQYAELSDLLFTAATVGKSNRGFIFNLDLHGTDFSAGLDLIERFLNEIAWRS